MHQNNDDAPDDKSDDNNSTVASARSMVTLDDNASVCSMFDYMEDMLVIVADNAGVAARAAESTRETVRETK